MRPRRILLAVGLLAVVAGGGYLAYRSPWVRAWFARDRESAEEIARLAGKKLELPPAADGNLGWPQWLGPTRDGRAPAGPLRVDWEKNPPKLVWKADCGGGYGSCAVVGGRVYLQDRRGEQERVLCLDAETGQTVWEYAYDAAQAGNDRQYAVGPRATPLVAGNRVYTVGGAGKLLCLETPAPDSAKPTVKWEQDLLAQFDASLPHWGVAGSPLLEGDLVIVQPGGRRGSVVAFGRVSGEVRWTGGSNPPSYSSPVAATVAGRRIIFALAGDALIALNAADGRVTGEYSWKTVPEVNVATPLVVDDYVFISSAYGMGCALLRAEPAGDGVEFVEVYARRKPPGIQNHHSTSVFKGRHLFGFDGQAPGFLRCVEFDTGRFIEDWSGERDVGKGTLILAGEHLVIQTAGGDLCLVEATPAEFRLAGKMSKVLSGRNNWATPTLVGGRLYLRDEEKVLCYDVR